MPLNFINGIQAEAMKKKNASTDKFGKLSIFK